MMLDGRLRCINSRRRSRSELIIASARQHHALIKDNSIKQNYFDSNMIKKGKITVMQRFATDLFSADVNAISFELSFISKQGRFL